MSTLADNEESDEKPHNRSALLARYDILEIITFDPSIYTKDHPEITVSNSMEKFIDLKPLKRQEKNASENVVC